MDSILQPLTVSCNSCGETAETWDFQNPDRAVTCGCCMILHDHTGIGCRPVTITAHANLTLFTPEELLEIFGELPTVHPIHEEVN